jgi:SP family sugar:H+ symporter-like MFS transporter
LPARVYLTIKAAMAQRSSAYVLGISLVAAIGGFLFGFDSGVINGAVEALATTFGSSHIGTGFSVGAILLGCAVGAFFAGTLADHFGRRPMMVVTALVFAVSAWGCGAAEAAAEFVFYRLLGGLAVGAASVLAPAYISEVAPAELRGRLASLQQLAIVIGLFAAFLSNYFIANLSGGALQPFWFGIPSWRWMLWAEAIPSLLFLLGALMIPESPRFLVARGRVDAAKQVFARIPGTEASAMVAEVQRSLGDFRKPRLADLLEPSASATFSRRLRPILWVGIGLSVFQQLVGINVVFYYGEVLWQSAGFTEDQALLTNVITGLTNVLSTVVAIALIDKVGRRPLLLAGSIGMTITLGALAALFGTAQVDAAGHLALGALSGKVALAAANLYVIFFAVSWGPVVWVLLGEMFENRIRGAALAVAAAAQWLANFLVTMTFPALLHSIGLTGSYALYAAAAAVSWIFVLRNVRETKGLTLEQMGGL